jgi:hypothetical protein
VALVAVLNQNAATGGDAAGPAEPRVQLDDDREEGDDIDDDPMAAYYQRMKRLKGAGAGPTRYEAVRARRGILTNT